MARRVFLLSTRRMQINLDFAKRRKKSKTAEAGSRVKESKERGGEKIVEESPIERRSNNTGLKISSILALY